LTTREPPFLELSVPKWSLVGKGSAAPRNFWDPSESQSPAICLGEERLIRKCLEFPNTPGVLRNVEKPANVAKVYQRQTSTECRQLLSLNGRIRVKLWLAFFCGTKGSPIILKWSCNLGILLAGEIYMHVCAYAMHMSMCVGVRLCSE
jgi:hypothetical protein